MNKRLGYIGQKKPKDYTIEKYIALPVCVEFKNYFKEVGSISPMILESEISLNFYDISSLPIKVDVFLRDKFEANIKHANDKAKEFYKKLAIIRGNKLKEV